MTGMKKTDKAPGRYTVDITATLYADNQWDAYRQVERALDRSQIALVEVEDTRVEPYCVHVDIGLWYGNGRNNERDLAAEGSALCAACQKADRLTPGYVYDKQALEDAHIGWSASKVEGYHLEYYFDGDGRYRGPDADGVEPLFNLKGATD